jgi:carbamoyltransferase
MNILGISCYYHDSSAALLIDGKIVAAAQEERFTRKKHDTSFPVNSVDYCLKSQNLRIENIDYIAFYEKPLLKFERLLYQHLQYFPKSYKTFVSNMPSWFNEKLRVLKAIKKKLKYKKSVLFIDHHMAHAAGSFLPSPFEKSAIVTIDGVGEWTTTSYGVGEKNKIFLLKQIRFPHSLGLLYSAITAYLGFSVNNSEYKVMGLSAYGNTNRRTNVYYNKFKEIVDIKEDGSYNLDMSYFTYCYKNKMPSKKLFSLLGGKVRKPNEEITQRHKDIAAALQLTYEDVFFKILNHVYNETKCENLVLAGGSCLNSVANGKILKQSPFKNVWAQPDPGDGGTSIGAALFVWNSLLNKKRSYVLDNPYLGPKYSTAEIKQFLKESSIKFSEFREEKTLIKQVSNLIFKDNVVGWFQGGMEWGPRALGGRSILSNPANPKMQEILNLKVKHREKFRPFAPVVCEDDALKYFDCDKPIPRLADFMLMVYPVKKAWHKKIPSVTHVDGSGRIQTIRKKNNALYYNLIKEFGKLSGIPILINTSFNIRGEPIVCSPRDAYRCMMGTGIDYLVLGNFLIKREDNPKDFWDSEDLAKD